MVESDQPIVNIIGEKIALGPLSRAVMAALDFLSGNDFAVTIFKTSRRLSVDDLDESAAH